MGIILLSRIFKVALILFFLSSFLLFLFIGIKKPFWLDELYTIQIIENDNPVEIFSKLFEGSDTNAPLYFIVLKIYTYFFGDSVVSLKLFSTIFIILSILLLYYFLKRIDLEFFDKFIIIYFFFISQVVSTYLLVEVRTYSFNLFLIVLFVVVFFDDSIKPKKNTLLILSLVTASLLYTHYFNLYFILVFLLFELLSRKRKNVAFSIIIGMFFFSPWLISVYLQFKIGQGLVHHSVPNIYTIFNQYLFLVGKGGLLIIFILLVIILLYYKKVKMSQELLLSISILILPLVNILLSIIGLSVHSNRYFTFSLIGFIFLLTDVFRNYGIPTYFKGLILFFLLAVTINRANFYYDITIAQNQTIANYLEFIGNDKIVIAESPHLAYPLAFYSANINIYFVK